jgi:hypothetical protein
LSARLVIIGKKDGKEFEFLTSPAGNLDRFNELLEILRSSISKFELLPDEKLTLRLYFGNHTYCGMDFSDDKSLEVALSVVANEYARPH